MASTKRSKTSTPVAKLLNAPTRLPGENFEDYEELFEQFFSAVRPNDPIEEALLCDVVYLTWDIARLRRTKDAFVAAHCPEGLKHVLATVIPHPDAESLARRWAKRDPEAVTQVTELLAASDLTIDAALAETIVRYIKWVDGMDHLITKAEARRNMALRSIDAHRAALAEATERALFEIDARAYKDDGSTLRKISDGTNHTKRAQARR